MVAKLTRIFVSLMRPRLTIKTHIAKLKMIESQEQNKTSAIPKFMPKILLDDVILLKFKTKGSLQCVSCVGQKIM